jgi:hypothetical protein
MNTETFTTMIETEYTDIYNILVFLTVSKDVTTNNNFIKYLKSINYNIKKFHFVDEKIANVWKNGFNAKSINKHNRYRKIKTLLAFSIRRNFYHLEKKYKINIVLDENFVGEMKLAIMI